MKDKANIIYRILGIVCVIVITVFGTMLLKMETADKSVIMKPDLAAVTENKQEITVNINTAAKEELMMLENIGAQKADDIIEHRNKKPFEKIEDLMLVSGIGQKTFDKIKDHITID